MSSPLETIRRPAPAFTRGACARPARALQLLLAIGACAWTAGSALAAAPAAPVAPVAMITDCVGDSAVIDAGSETPCEILSNLTGGERVRAGDGGRVTLVYFDSGREYAVAGGTVATVGETALEPMEGTAPEVRELALAKQTGLSASARPQLVQGAIVMRGVGRKPKVNLIDPKNTSVLDRHPVFRWQPLPETAQYRFALMDETGRAVIETLVNGTSFQLPPEVRLRENVYYSWEVEARLANGEEYTSAAEFTLLPASDRERVEALRPGPGAAFSERVVFATFLERMDLRAAAQRLWRELAAERPDDPTLAARAGR